MTVEAAPRRMLETDRNLALVTYGLLFAAIFFAGVPALIAVIIAYSQRDNVSPDLAHHHSYQIRIFWGAFVLSLAAGICGLTGLIMGLGDLVSFGGSGGWDRLIDGDATLAEVHMDTKILFLIGGAFIFSVAAALWLVVTPAYGFIRLVNQRPVGQGAA